MFILVSRLYFTWKLAAALLLRSDAVGYRPKQLAAEALQPSAPGTIAAAESNETVKVEMNRNNKKMDSRSGRPLPYQASDEVETINPSWIMRKPTDNRSTPTVSQRSMSYVPHMRLTPTVSVFCFL